MLLKRILLFALIVFVGACAPGLGTSLKVDYSEDPEITALKQNVEGNPPSIHVLKFVDARSIEAIAQIDGRLIKPSTDLGLVVQRAFESSLKKNGVRLALFNAPSIRGDIKEWDVSVTPAFPSTKIEAKAGVMIELFDGQQNKIHRALYSGVFNQEHPFIGESDVQSALAKSLGIAIREALSDPILINKIATLPGSRPAVAGHLPQ